jgi:hypothetical protein
MELHHLLSLQLAAEVAVQAAQAARKQFILEAVVAVVAL